MSQNGSLIVRTYLSRAQLPVSGATVIISRPEESGKQTLISISRTNESGVTGPISLESPDVSGSLSPGNNGSAFSSYTLIVEHPDYQLAVFEGLQVFPGIETVQDVPLIPISANGITENDTTVVTPQPL